MNKQRRYLIVLAVLVIFGGLTAWYKFTPGPYDALAQCIGNSGAKYYGAFWCPRCQEQKQVFSKSAKYLPYVECSTPDQKGQLPVCNEAGITTYPTWIFADGTKEAGVKTPQYLAEKTTCAIN